jgi:hypothetical protein
MKNRARLAYREIVPARRPIVQPKLLPIGRFIRATKSRPRR